MIEFYHDKGMERLKLGCMLPNLANICLQYSKSFKIHPNIETHKGLLEKKPEATVGGPLLVFTREAVVDKIFTRKSTNLCKCIVGIDASQLYPYQCVSQGPLLYKPDGRATVTLNNSHSFKTNRAHSRTWSFHIFNEINQIVQLRVILLLVDKKVIVSA